MTDQGRLTGAAEGDKPLTTSTEGEAMALSERDLSKAAGEQGFEVSTTAKGHLKFVPPDPARPIVYGSGTPGDVRSVRNLLARLRASGLIWPWPADKGRINKRKG